jgi:hypothetical protein
LKKIRKKKLPQPRPTRVPDSPAARPETLAAADLTESHIFLFPLETEEFLVFIHGTHRICPADPCLDFSAGLECGDTAMGANADPSGSLGGPNRRLSSPVPAPPPLTLPQHQHGVGASTVAALRHDPGLAARWSPEEQVLLDKGLAE